MDKQAALFSWVQDGIYALRKASIFYTYISQCSFHNVAFETVPTFVWSTMALSSFQGKLSNTFSFHTSPIKMIDGVM